MQLFNQLTAAIPSGAVLAAASVVVDGILRFIPSQKPLSLLYVVRDTVKAGADFVESVVAAVDQVLPQRLSAPKA